MAERASNEVAEKSVHDPTAEVLEVERAAESEQEKFHLSQLNKVVWPVSLGLLFAWTAQQEIPTVINPILGPLNASLGPSETYTWISSAYNMAIAISWCFVGPLSDALGRRWFFLCGGVLGIIGGIVAGTAKSVNTVIIGMTFLGVAAASQQVSAAAAAEIFPMKWRGYVQAAIEALPFAFNTFGSLIGYSMVKSATWRWGFYINIIIAAISTLLLFFFYHPPVPQKELSRFQILKTIDFVGCGLFMAGLGAFLLGLTWAAGSYPWKSAPVLVPMLLGVLLLVKPMARQILFFQDGYSKDLQGAFTQFKKLGLADAIYYHRMISLTIVVFIGSIPLYAMLSGWAQEVTILFTQDPLKIGIYGIPQGVGLEFGAVFAGLLVKIIGHTHLQLTASAFFTTLFVALMAVLTPKSINPAFAFLLLGCMAMNYLQVTAMIMAQLGVEHRDLAKATGLLSIARNAGGAIAVAMFYSILRSRVSANLPPRVTDAVLALGLPESSLPGVLQGVASFNQTMINEAPGATPAIAEAAVYAGKLAYAASFRVIYYVGLGLGVVSIVAAYFTNDVISRMTDTLQVDLNEKDHAHLFKPTQVEGVVRDEP
ncbi:hypothetical protein AYO20_06222 [Fonsecaea nubica]|uniref:Major facilitator superfamily (MFS) profile domain-containing protein n=1 Tax=Fonsecaea nubica TaxID=856822 RepID=A0A178CZ77_9EURO|nr:hypothetical protein AYO20_06222 [Fonsecaea nubica]OAL34592.1 hypothetical protein AYO20_06222 [Fonsecaea nubica]